MTSRIFSAVAGLALAAGTVAISTPVFAADADQSSALIQIGDLDLTAPEGMQSLERRVRKAANDVCGTVPVRDLRMRSLVAECHAQVRASAMSQAELAMGASRPGLRLALRSE